MVFSSWELQQVFVSRYKSNPSAASRRRRLTVGLPERTVASRVEVTEAHQTSETSLPEI
jgi:hypothetical protein